MVEFYASNLEWEKWWRETEFTQVGKVIFSSCRWRHSWRRNKWGLTASVLQASGWMGAQPFLAFLLTRLPRWWSISEKPQLTCSKQQQGDGLERNRFHINTLHQLDRTKSLKATSLVKWLSPGFYQVKIYHLITTEKIQDLKPLSSSSPSPKQHSLPLKRYDDKP